MAGSVRAIGVLILLDEELVLFSFGLIGILCDRTRSGASGEDGIYLLLCSLEGHRFVIIRDHDVVKLSIVNWFRYISNITFGVFLLLLL